MIIHYLKRGYPFKQLEEYINWSIIEYSNDCTQTFPVKPVISFKRLPNLENKLTKASISFSPKEIETRKIMPDQCSRLNKCTYCQHINKVDKITCKISGKQYSIIDLPNIILCELSDIIYLTHAQNVVSIL